MLRKLAACLVAGLALTPSSRAAQPPPNPWVGVWNLDYTTPHIGPRLTVTFGADNHFLMRREPYTEFDIVCDGTPHKSHDSERTCVRNGDREIIVTSPSPGDVERFVLRGDKEMVRIPPYEPNAYNPLETTPEEYYRLSPGTGFEGTWLSERYIGGSAEIDVTEPVPGYLLALFTQRDANSSGAELLPLKPHTAMKNGIGGATTVELVARNVLRVTEKPPVGSPFVTTYTVKGNTLLVQEKDYTLVYHQRVLQLDARRR